MSWSRENPAKFSAEFVFGFQINQADFLLHAQLDNDEWSLQGVTFEWILALGVDPRVGLLACPGSIQFRKTGVVVARPSE